MGNRLSPNRRAPWDFSPEPDPASPTVRPNLPTDEGRALGRELARLCDGEAAAHPDAPERCHDCAFRLGTPPNGCAPTLMDAMKCAIEGEPFLCHIDGKACAGWALMRFGRER